MLYIVRQTFVNIVQTFFQLSLGPLSPFLLTSVSANTVIPIKATPPYPLIERPLWVVGLGDAVGIHGKLLLALAKVGGEILHGLCAVLFIQAHLTKN